MLPIPPAALGVRARGLSGPLGVRRDENVSSQHRRPAAVHAEALRSPVLTPLGLCRPHASRRCPPALPPSVTLTDAPPHPEMKPLTGPGGTPVFLPTRGFKGPHTRPSPRRGRLCRPWMSAPTLLGASSSSMTLGLKDTGTERRKSFQARRDFFLKHPTETLKRSFLCVTPSKECADRYQSHRPSLLKTNPQKTPAPSPLPASSSAQARAEDRQQRSTQSLGDLAAEAAVLSPGGRVACGSLPPEPSRNLEPRRQGREHLTTIWKPALGPGAGTRPRRAGGRAGGEPRPTLTGLSGLLPSEGNGNEPV
ncbi:translation initiation factor IF-2-like [Panthera tigris]|uniref:translation initiation factor IF-2-like n=1 Tax=Panthera tigris TaxID=9694 RepID=UPI001C6FC521|nr:translation initiation factor IF-2-like [Panthera tigris]XP_042827122.1 translation initiation factor IF-2-like [Panthera tigris]